jgi:hypothetical protein
MVARCRPEKLNCRQQPARNTKIRQRQQTLVSGPASAVIPHSCEYSDWLRAVDYLNRFSVSSSHFGTQFFQNVVRELRRHQRKTSHARESRIPRISRST